MSDKEQQDKAAEHPKPDRPETPFGLISRLMTGYEELMTCTVLIDPMNDTIEIRIKASKERA